MVQVFHIFFWWTHHAQKEGQRFDSQRCKGIPYRRLAYRISFKSLVGFHHDRTGASSMASRET